MPKPTDCLDAYRGLGISYPCINWIAGVARVSEGGGMREVWIAFGLTVFAGLATGIGSVIAFMAKRTDYRFLSVACCSSG